MNPQPNTPSQERIQHTAAKRRLLRKAVLTLPIIMACTTLTAFGPSEVHQPSAVERIISNPRDGRGSRPDSPEWEREVMETFFETYTT